ncbi:MAG TPA: hypothetical protein VK148_31740 [Xanthobacteraceae bacterium]|jgi:hypothetical protein|nr:hypothetical protein [Xanthobacteraceae bacterium]
MLNRSFVTVIVAALAGALTIIGAQAADAPAKLPDWRGQWSRFVVPGLPGQPSHDQTKPWGKGQGAPLTPEYQAILEASIADQAQGGLGNFPTTTGRASGMPHMMMAFVPLEFVVTPDTTYILIGMYDHFRRIYTDGRDWPTNVEPTFQGYSIGKWIDEDGDGVYDVLEVETRNFKGPRAYDELGLPLHFDNQSVFKERFYRDKADPNIMHDILTTIDNALTRPWTVDKKYVRTPDPRPIWTEYDLSELNAQIMIGKENYFLSADGLLMPTKKNQAPPDVRYFTNTGK